MSKPSSYHVSYHVSCRVSRYISRITPRIKRFPKLVSGYFTAQNAFSRVGIRLLHDPKRVFPTRYPATSKRFAQSAASRPPWKGARVQIRAATKNIAGRPSLSAAFAENRKHRKLRGSLRSECQVPFSGVRLPRPQAARKSWADPFGWGAWPGTWDP